MKSQLDLTSNERDALDVALQRLDLDSQRGAHRIHVCMSHVTHTCESLKKHSLLHAFDVALQRLDLDL